MKTEKPFAMRLPYPADVFINRAYLRRWRWFPGAGDIRRRILIHKAGHVLGLCSDSAHGDGLHCENRNCLMNGTLHLRPARLVLPGKVLPQEGFCSDCLSNLASYRDSFPAENLRYIGPYFVRSEDRYHVVSTPGFVHVHVGPLDDLDSANLTARRRDKFRENPSGVGEYYETADLDLETARALIPRLEHDPLETVRRVGDDLKKKLSDL